MKKVSSISTNPSKDNPVQQKINEINDLLAQDLVRFQTDISRQCFDEVAPELSRWRHELTLMSHPAIEQESVLNKTLSIKKQ